MEVGGAAVHLLQGRRLVEVGGAAVHLLQGRRANGGGIYNHGKTKEVL